MRSGIASYTERPSTPAAGGFQCREYCTGESGRSRCRSMKHGSAKLVAARRRSRCFAGNTPKPKIVLEAVQSLKSHLARESWISGCSRASGSRPEPALRTTNDCAETVIAKPPKKPLWA